MDTSKTSLLPYSENDNILADKFNNYFVEKIVKIRDNLDTPVVSLHTPLNNNITNLCNFSPVDSETILKQIRSSNVEKLKFFTESTIRVGTVPNMRRQKKMDMFCRFPTLDSSV